MKLMNTEGKLTMNTFYAITAYKTGEAVSKALNVKGKGFKGAFQIADFIGYERDSIEWNLAVSGALQHLEGIEVITDKDNILI